MAKAGNTAASEAPAVAFKPKHPLVLVASAKEASQLKSNEISALLPILIALHSTKTPFDLASPSECKNFASP